MMGVQDFCLEMRGKRLMEELDLKRGKFMNF